MRRSEPGVEPVFPEKDQAIDYARKSRLLSLRRGPDFRFKGKCRAHHSLRRCESKAVNAVSETHEHAGDFKEYLSRGILAFCACGDLRA
jgi:hypothetical protein